MTYNGSNYEEIEAALVRLGATEQEADALTDVLHVEGWGGVEDREMNDEVLANMIAWLRENRPVDPRADWDDSNYIDIIESEKDRWFAASPCTTPTDDETDSSINKMLGFPPGGCIHVDGLTGALKDETEDEIRASVRAGLDAWYGTVDTSAVEYYDQLPEPSAEVSTEFSIAGKHYDNGPAFVCSLPYDDDIDDDDEDSQMFALKAALGEGYECIWTDNVGVGNLMDVVILPIARREYRENDYEISIATREQLDAIDAGRKAPCLA